MLAIATAREPCAVNVLRIPPRRVSVDVSWATDPSSNVTVIVAKSSTSCQPSTTCLRGSARNDSIAVSRATWQLTAVGRMGGPWRRSPSSRFNCNAAPIGWTHSRTSEPPPAARQRRAAALWEPECDSSPSMRKMVD